MARAISERIFLITYVIVASEGASNLSGLERAASRPSHHRPVTIAVALLLASASVAAQAASATAAEGAGAAQPRPADDSQQPIVITAPPVFRGIQPERSLDQDAIHSYGISTIDELVGEIQIELGEDEAPIIYVNGQRINDLSEIGALPVEALRRLHVRKTGVSAPRLDDRGRSRRSAQGW